MAVCPLCDAPTARFEAVRGGKRFVCPACGGPFLVDQHAQDYLAGLVEVPKTEFRAMLRDAIAKMPPGHRYVIRQTWADESGNVTAYSEPQSS